MKKGSEKNIHVHYPGLELTAPVRQSISSGPLSVLASRYKHGPPNPPDSTKAWAKNVCDHVNNCDPTYLEGYGMVIRHPSWARLSKFNCRKTLCDVE